MSPIVQKEIVIERSVLTPANRQEKKRKKEIQVEIVTVVYANVMQKSQLDIR